MANSGLYSIQDRISRAWAEITVFQLVDLISYLLRPIPGRMSARAEDAQSRPGSSGFVKAFESLGPPPNLPPAQPQGLKEDDRPPSMRELLESFATRKKAEKEEKDQQEVRTWPVASF